MSAIISLNMFGREIRIPLSPGSGTTNQDIDTLMNGATITLEWTRGRESGTWTGATYTKTIDGGPYISFTPLPNTIKPINAGVCNIYVKIVKAGVLTDKFGPASIEFV